MKSGAIAIRCLEALKKSGARQAQCVVVGTARHQVRSEAGRLSLLRSVSENKVHLLAIKNGRQGEASVNSAEKEDVGAAIAGVLEGIRSSTRDAAYGISERQPGSSYIKGPRWPDLAGMKSRLEEFLGDCKKYRGLIVAEASISFVAEDKLLANSNGVRHRSLIGHYSLELAFSSSSGGRSSSVNFVSRTFGDLAAPLISRGGLSTLLEQSVESVGARPVRDKFQGDIIVAPECLDSFLNFLTEDSLRDVRLISGTSVYRDKLGLPIASGGLTLRSMPLSAEITPGYSITKDGYKAGNCTVLENGVLRTFLLSRYGAKKTGLGRAANSGGGYIIDPGRRKLEEMLRSVKRGLLVGRFSGGAPNAKGDFSGIAKNSFFVENGKKRFPVSETMISGNIPEMLLRIRDISIERLSLGESVYPWITFSGITISGK